MTDDDRRAVELDVDELQDRLRRILENLGSPADVAAEVSLHLVSAEQSGHASHGVLRMAQYAREIDEGSIDPAGRPTVVNRSGAATVLDAHHGFGHFSAATAVDVAARSAREHGVATVAIRDATHIGRLGEYAERLADLGLVSIIVAAAAGPGIGSMAPFGSSTGFPFLNTNPWAMGYPGADAPIIFDAAMSVIPEGKVHAALARGEDVPEGALLDRHGAPSMSPQDFLDGGTLTPLGGPGSGHKGYGLALSAALLGGLAQADAAAPQLNGLAQVRGADEGGRRTGGVTIIALDVAAFSDRGDEYAERTTRLSGAIRADGALVPGDVERKARRRADGTVTLPGETRRALEALERGTDPSTSTSEETP
ncbi:Ldh family oxidoreductase [Brachybacterium sp. NPDC056505]|uniref:Ldh family oxidoreductase n=1 Tax=Brachybacterium sp. NPDC056505 TaxID=3345843 RepID=UPI00366C74C3